MKNFVLTTLFFSAILTSVSAQNNSNGSGYFGLGLLMGAPIGEHKTFNDELAVGLGINFLYQPSDNIPVMVGLDLEFLGNGNRTQYETIYADIKVGDVIIDQLQFPFRIETTNSIFAGHFILRAMAPIKYFKPYVDGIVGFNNFSTTTSIYDESEEHYFTETDNPLITSKSQLSDWALSYGGAFGIMVQCSENFFIDLRCAYSVGSEAEYFTEDDIEDWDVEFTTTPTDIDDLNDDDISISAIPKHSETSMIMPSLGITFKF